MNDQEISWDEIEVAYRKLVDDLTGFELLDDGDYNIYRLSQLTYGLIPAPHWLKVDYGMAVHVHARSRSIIRELWIGLADEVGAKRSPGLTLPSHVVQSRPPRASHFAVVEAALSERRVTDQFLDSWARLHALHMQFRLLSMRDEASGAAVDQALAGAHRSVEVQLRWYAHWLRRNAASLAPEDRVAPGQELALLCADVGHGRVLPWGPYPIEWYTRLLSVDGEASAPELGDNFIKLGRPKIEQLLNDPLLTPAVLPPLSRDDFERGPPPPGDGGS